MPGVNVRLLVDGIVRQTTVLIAQLSTAAGVRAPLAHIVDQVFLDLSREIEAQGIGRKVAADMFGMALRAYQKKTQRLAESTTEQNRTLWQSMVDFLQRGPSTRSRIAERFQFDGEREVAAVLGDLVSSGLVYVTGRGETAVYGLSRDEDRHLLATGSDLRSVAQVVWLEVFLGEARTEDTLANFLKVDPGVITDAVDLLVEEGRIVRGKDGLLLSSNVVIPVGGGEGWEAAVLDHFRAVATAIGRKGAGGGVSSPRDEIGGHTFTFSVYPGHPHEAEVRALLRAMRGQISLLWERVAEQNRTVPVPADAARVTFYLGQTIVEAEEREGPEVRVECVEGVRIDD